MNLKIDDKDWKILFELQRDSRISMAELGRKVSLSSPSVHARVSKLEDKGVIHSYKTMVDHIKAGFQLKAMIMLRVFMGKLNPFLDVVPSFKEVVNCSNSIICSAKLTTFFGWRNKSRICQSVSVRKFIIDPLQI